MDMKYCIIHERMVVGEHDHNGNFFHAYPMTYYIGDELVFDWDECVGPFAECPPPEITEEEWEATFNDEPCPDELEYMDEECSNFFVNAE